MYSKMPTEFFLGSGWPTTLHIVILGPFFNRICSPPENSTLYRDTGDFKINASISLINVYRLSKVDLQLKLILRYVINVFLASCQVSQL